MRGYEGKMIVHLPFFVEKGSVASNEEGVCRREKE